MIVVDCPVHYVSCRVDDDHNPESGAAADVWSPSDACLRVAVLRAGYLRAGNAAGGW